MTNLGLTWSTNPETDRPINRLTDDGRRPKPKSFEIWMGDMESFQIWMWGGGVSCSEVRKVRDAVQTFSEPSVEPCLWGCSPPPQRDVSLFPSFPIFDKENQFPKPYHLIDRFRLGDEGRLERVTPKTPHPQISALPRSKSCNFWVLDLFRRASVIRQVYRSVCLSITSNLSGPWFGKDMWIKWHVEHSQKTRLDWWFRKGSGKERSLCGSLEHSNLQNYSVDFGTPHTQISKLLNTPHPNLKAFPNFCQSPIQPRNFCLSPSVCQSVGQPITPNSSGAMSVCHNSFLLSTSVEKPVLLVSYGPPYD